MKQSSSSENREDSIAAGAVYKSVSQQNQERKERRSIIAQFFADHSWEKNEWRDSIDDLYGRMDGSLLYKIQKEESFNDDALREKIFLLQEMRQKLAHIYEVLQEKDKNIKTSPVDRARWLEKMKQVFIVEKQKGLDEDVFFEIPKERRMRMREERRSKGEDIRSRVLKELEMIQDIRKNFPWEDIPLEITTNMGSFLLRVIRSIGR